MKKFLISCVAATSLILSSSAIAGSFPYVFDINYTGSEEGPNPSFIGSATLSFNTDSALTNGFNDLIFDNTIDSSLVNAYDFDFNLQFFFETTENNFDSKFIDISILDWPVDRLGFGLYFNEVSELAAFTNVNGYDESLFNFDLFGIENSITFPVDQAIVAMGLTLENTVKFAHQTDETMAVATALGSTSSGTFDGIL